MQINTLKAIIKTAARGAAVLFLGAGLAQAQTVVSLSAGPATVTLPDGSNVPMWGYTCGTTSGGACTALNSTASSGSWSPIVITVPYAGTSTSLAIKLTNNLPAPVPTSLTIVGQIGGGLGQGFVNKPSPNHDNQGTTWPIANSGAVFTPPSQADRVQSFATEVAPGTTSAALTWSALRPGTYLLESGTHPSIQGPMGLYGMVVVTTAPSGSGTAGLAYTGVNYQADVPLLFSEIDPIQNRAVSTAVSTSGFSETATVGPYSTGPVTSINITNGGKNYTSSPTVAFSGGSPAVGGNAAATADIDTDPASATFGQVTAINIINAGSYSSAPTIQISNGGGSGATAVTALQPQTNAAAHCSGGAGACYPPVVNYTPLYYLINGVAFDKTNTTGSVFPVSPASGVTGDVLIRMVNAGLHMHVPSIVGAQPSSLSPANPAAGGFTLVAEDGNVLPGVPRIQSEVFMAAGKTYDVMVKAPTGGTALPVFDRQLSLSSNATARDAGMLGYVSVNGTLAPVVPNSSAKANADVYSAVIPGQTLTIADPGKGVIANDVNIFGVKVTTGPSHGALTLKVDGTFTYAPDSTWGGSDSFAYCGNGSTTSDACTTVTLNAASVEAAGNINCTGLSFTSSLSKTVKINAPGVLAGCTDGKGYPLTVNAASIAPASGLTVNVDPNGGFTASVTASGAYSFTFKAQNAQGTVGSAAATIMLTFPVASNLNVKVLDGADKSTQISDYRWIIEEDRTFFVDPNCAQNPVPAGCPGSTTGVVPNFGTNFHTSYMPVIASGCTGNLSCGSNQTVLGSPVAPQAPSSPGDVALCNTATPAVTNCLDPKKRYYISVLPGDAAQPFIAGYAGAPDCSAAGVAAGSCGHGMGGAPIPVGPHSGQSVTILTEPSPYPPATLTVFVFEDDFPLNGEHDAGGGIDVLSPNEAGLGGFQITLSDNAGGTGDSTGTPTYDMFNMPLSNSLAGTLDPVTKEDACPISTQDTQALKSGDTSQAGVAGMIITCPKYESDGKTLSPLAGQAVVKNLYPGRYGVTANPGADRIAAGEEWLQTNTLDGQKAHDSFMRIGEPGYFQEFGPAGYHVTIGFANPKVINDRRKAMCGVGVDCSHEVKGHITTARMSRTPDERLYGSGSHDSYSFTQCYVSLGDPDGADFAFAKCDGDGNFDLTGLPAGNWKVTTFDQWNDQVVDGITTPVGMCDPGTTNHCKGIVDMGEMAVHQWQANIYTRTFFDTDFSGVSTDSKPGLAFVDTNIRFRDGSYSNFNSTDLNGFAGFNEVFPLFNWYVIETDSTRYKNTGTHVVYDSGGPADASSPDGNACAGSSTTSKPCGNSTIAANMANTYEPNPLPADLSIPGAVYCAEGADCGSSSIAGGPKPSDVSNHSTGRIDPAWVNSYGWQGFSGQNSFLEFGKKPFSEGENGGIHGHVVYASTRPFDDPQLLLQLSWEPLVPHVRINLYKEGLADDNVTKTLTLVDHTDTTSFDDWAQGFHLDAHGNAIPNMNCPGQGTNTSEMPDPYFWFALKDQPQWLDLYNNNGVPSHAIPHDSQFKCYDGMHNWNQLQPAPYDGMYSFPSVLSLDPATGKAAGTNCSICMSNPSSTDSNNPNYDPYRAGTPMLPDGKYVVEVVVPSGYELVKEEDKNILIGDNFIAPVTQQFGGLGSVFILPDQAEVGSSYNPNNAQNSTNSQGRNSNLPSHEADTGSVETYWPCVGTERVVPDFISLFPGSQEVAPFAGAKRPLCDRKEVTLTDQTSALAKFYVFTPTHTASHFTGVITDDFSAEFDPFSPQFGEKFAPAYLPVSIKDWAGNEVNRVYSDAWGAYNGLNYSTWEVNPPNPTGYGPTMMVTCMNDAGPIPDPANPNQAVTDPLYQSGYSQFCYELPFMPAQTGYFDTPVVPTSAFAGDYNSPDCSYPDTTPAISEVDGDGVGPWVAGLKGTVTAAQITANGSGYTTTPTVTFNNTGTGGTGAAATAKISGSVSAVTVTNKITNRGYTSAPAISFNGGSGSGASATANMTGSVTSVAISNGGSYASAPSVTFSAPVGGGTTATGTVMTAVILGSGGRRRVTGVTITNAGSGYTGTATVTFSLTGTPSASATAKMGQSVASVLITNAGSGYTTAPAVAFSAAPTGGQTATGNSTEVASVVAINITNQGSNYASAPTITISGGGGSGATASASVEINGNVTITALGDQAVDNYNYSGPSATGAPYNKQKVTRHYGFGTRCTAPAAGSTTCNTASAVTIGGQAATIVSWSDSQIAVSVPAGIPSCAVQQQAQYGGSAAQCGQLVITAGNGKQSIDAVNVTVGGKAPTHVPASATIQSAIDLAAPGDLIIIDPTCTQTGAGAVACNTTPPVGTQIAKSNAAHSEMLLMWKPVRLQGVGAASSIIDANPHPAGKLDPWRRQIVCLFGLALNGQPYTSAGGANPFDPNSTFSCPGTMKYFSGGPNYPTMVVDRIPMEGILGWDTTVNGNLAEQLIEPSLMGAYEGAGITVLAKGVNIPPGATDLFGSGSESAFPTGSVPLKATDCATGPSGANLYPSNFLCNPSSIDGLTVKNSSQGGGGILVHAWAHNLQIANNRIFNNQGTLSGGITIGQGEHPDVPLVGGGVANVAPGSCITNTGLSPNNVALPYCYDMDVNVHNNSVTQNSSLGDELFSSTPAGAGGVTFCNGSDYYKFSFNWICGNMSTGDGAGVAHIGFTYDGDIEHNTILFNQSTNPTIVTNGGGLLIMGAPDPDPPCATNDQDCVSPAGTITPSDGTGPGLVINANLILGNSADAGSGGGLRLQHINGTEVLNFPRGNAITLWPSIPGHSAQPGFQLLTPWNGVQVTNNIIADNVAGLDGGGLSLLDALATDVVNNTVVSNNSTASAGVLLQTLFAPLASTQGTNCTTNNGSQSCPQIAGLVSVTNSAVLVANIGLLPGGTGSVTCPTNHGTSGSCTKYSVPALYNDLFWQNRSMMIGVGGLNTTALQNQQNTVTLYNADFGKTAVPAASQTSTGACNDTNASYWDIGVRGDVQPGDHSGGTLSPLYSLLTNNGSLTENGGGSNNLLAPTAVVGSTYCDGSRVPVEAVLAGFAPAGGWQVPPGTNESNALPAPPFTLGAAATVDEGNNWINLRWGPLSMNVLNAAGNPVFTFNPSLVGSSPAIDHVPSTAGTPYAAAPGTDFYGNPRKTNNAVDVGAIEFIAPPSLTVTPASLAFGAQVVSTTSATKTLTLTSTFSTATTINSIVVSAPFARPTLGGTCGATLAANTSCTINVVFTPTATGPATGTVTITAAGVGVVNSPVALTGTGVAPRSATVSPSPLAFGNLATGTTAILNLTVTSTGNTALAGGTFSNLAAPFSRITTGTFPAGAPNCGVALAVGASCTIKVQYAPTTTTTSTASLAVAYTGATITGTPVSISGTGVTARATVAISPKPFSITLPSGTLTGSGNVTLTNTAAAGGSSVSVTNVAVTGAGLIWSFTANGTNTCTGALLAPGASCTVTVQFGRIGSVGTHTGAITFTDTATGSPQSLTLTGIAQ